MRDAAAVQAAVFFRQVQPSTAYTIQNESDAAYARVVSESIMPISDMRTARGGLSKSVHGASVVLFLIFLTPYLAGDVYRWMVVAGVMGTNKADIAPDAKVQEALKDIVVPDAKLGYKLVSPNHSEAQGQRLFAGRTVNIAKKPHTFRVICVGGSTTIGIDNPKHSYPAMLQELFDHALAHCAFKVEVINAGVMGYHSWHTRLRAGDDLDALSPDLYLIMDGQNDIMAAAAIENVEEAVRQRNVLTRLVNMGVQGGPHQGSQATPQGFSDMVMALDGWDFFRNARKEMESWFTPDAMELKMKAFGFMDNMEAFIRERQAKGIGVAFVNYGWITKAHASVQSESTRIPYHFNIPLFQFGRKYVADVLRDLSDRFHIPLIDVQPWVDALSAKKYLLYRLFSDEMHYTQFMNFFVAREIYGKLLAIPALTRHIGACELPSLAETDAAFSYRLSWGESFTGNGYPKDPASVCPLLAIETFNLGHNPHEPCGADAEQWCAAIPLEGSEEGVLTCRLSTAGRKGLIIFFPRIFSNHGMVEVEMRRGGEWQKVAGLIRSVGDGEWSPVEARYGFAVPEGDGQTLELRARLQGSAQIFHKGGRYFFFQPQ